MLSMVRWPLRWPPSHQPIRPNKYAVAGMPHWSNEETDNPLRADDLNFYKVEKWTKDGEHVAEMLYAGSNLHDAYEVFHSFARKRLPARLTIRQRERVIAECPPKK
jgi:hypothetical protein